MNSRSFRNRPKWPGALNLNLKYQIINKELSQRYQQTNWIWIFSHLLFMQCILVKYKYFSLWWIISWAKCGILTNFIVKKNFICKRQFSFWTFRNVLQNQKLNFTLNIIARRMRNVSPLVQLKSGLSINSFPANYRSVDLIIIGVFSDTLLCLKPKVQRKINFVPSNHIDLYFSSFATELSTGISLAS